jgi:hypothetical protein
MNVAARVLRRLIGSDALGATDDVGRNFMVCYVCKAVVPAWRLVVERVQASQGIGCPCGSPYVRQAIIPAYRAAWWYFVRGLLVRRVIQRQSAWDPRVPIRRKL